MKSSIVYALDARRPKKDGTCPVLMRIVHYGKTSPITTGIYVKPSDWDARERKIKGTYKGTASVASLNNMLQKKKAEAMDIITKLDEKKLLDTYTVLGLKELIERKPERTSFIAYAEALIAGQTEAGRIGNARSYQMAVNALRALTGRNDLAFYEINLALLNRFEREHLKKGNSYNGLASYLRAIRAIYNQAIKSGLVDREMYPFANYEIKTSKTRKRAISLESIQKIEQLALKATHPLYRARHYFLASFYMRGMSFADLAELKVSDIVGNHIHYCRKKTHKPYTIKIPEQLKQILEEYKGGKERAEFIFPIIKHEDAKGQYADMVEARRRFNKKLKKLGFLCGIEEPLTSYVSRHSFATGAKNLGIPIAAISEMLGHENIKTTEVYLDSLPSNILDDYHEQVLNGGLPAKILLCETEQASDEVQSGRNNRE